ncbi:cytokinin dehydrogenase 3-like protein [Tanacetum coccineum]
MERGFLSQKGSRRGRGVKEKDLNRNLKNTSSGIGVSMDSDDTMDADTLSGGASAVQEGVTPSVVDMMGEAGSAPGRSSYANVTGKPSEKKLNIRTFFTSRGNGIDVVVPVESIRAINRLDAMLENGPWFIPNNLLILKKWHPDENLLKEDVNNIPVWVKLHDVPVTAFSDDGLSAIATKLGTLLMLDSYTADMCMQSWGRSSYARVMIELRADVELKDNIVMAMPKITRKGQYTCNVRVEYEWKPPRRSSCKVFEYIHEECPKNTGAGEKKTVKKPSQNSRGVLVSLKMGFKPQKEYRPVPKKPNASPSGNKKKGVEPTIEVSNSNPFDVLNSVNNDVELVPMGGLLICNTPIAKKIDKIERQICEGKLRLLDNNGNPLVPTDGSDKGYGTNSLLEQWRDSYPDNDDYDPYDDDMYENHDLSKHPQSICDDLDITVRGRNKK